MLRHNRQATPITQFEGITCCLTTLCFNKENKYFYIYNKNKNIVPTAKNSSYLMNTCDLYHHGCTGALTSFLKTVDDHCSIY